MNNPPIIKRQKQMRSHNIATLVAYFLLLSRRVSACPGPYPGAPEWSS